MVKMITNIEFTTDWVRVSAYESESVWSAIITYDNGHKTRFNHKDKDELIKIVKENIK